MKINLNVQATVTLTEYGAKVYNDSSAKLRGRFPDLFKTVEPGFVLKTGIWDLMKVFGPSIFMGMRQVPFENNEIEISSSECH